MFDELEWLRGSPELQRLLGHYAEATVTDREAWQDRLMHLEGVEPRELVRRHGELLAFGWIEQNTGHTPLLRPGAVPCCYRVTPAGLRALEQARRAAAAGDEGEAVAAVAGGPEVARGGGGETPAPGRREGRRTKATRARKAVAADVVQPEPAAGVPAAVPG
jgi:hypothetical protein